MRTTLTIDDDVAVELERLRKKRDQSLKQLVNDVLRQGLARIAEPEKAKAPVVTKTLNLGKCLIGNIDDISEVLALLEGEDYR